MQLIDLEAQQARIRAQLEKRIHKVLDHGTYIMGPEITELEGCLSDFAGVDHAVACASGTDALLMALMALGVGPGHAVFTTPFTFIATAEVIALIGATPVFVDVDPETFNMDALQLSKAIEALAAADNTIYPLPEAGKRGSLAPKGIIAVDLFGLPVDYTAIRDIARKNGLFLIGDSAQSLGAEYKGKKAIAFSHIACTSFFPAKPLGGYGDGGMCFTGDEELARSIRSIRVHGKGAHKYDNTRIGINGRMDTLQAAILLAKFEVFPEEIELRQAAADRYTRLLSDIRTIKTPTVPEGCKSAWAQYSILAGNNQQRNALQRALKAMDIPTAVYYPLPLHLQRAFAYLCYPKTAFPVSESLSERIFSLPMHPYLTRDQQMSIAAGLLENDGGTAG